MIAFKKIGFIIAAVIPLIAVATAAAVQPAQATPAASVNAALPPGPQPAGMCYTGFFKDPLGCLKNNAKVEAGAAMGFAASNSPVSAVRNAAPEIKAATEEAVGKGADAVQSGVEAVGGAVQS